MPSTAKSHDTVNHSNNSSLHVEKQRHNSDHDHKSPFFVPAKKGLFFQPSLKVNRINDPYEVEADRVAEDVASSFSQGNEGGFTPPDSPSDQGKPGGKKSGFFQRKAAFESPTELDMNSANEEGIQTKSNNKLISMIQRLPVFESPTEMEQNSAANENVQRSAETAESTTPPVQNREEENSEGESHDIQRKQSTQKRSGGQQVSKGFESRLQSSKGGGEPLKDNTKNKMESAFDADFSGVRVHTGSGSESMNNQVGAHAFTHGSDIYFNQNQYDPESRSGSKLLAHELTHVVQQGGADKKSVQRSANAQNVTQSAPKRVQRLGISDALDYFADKANNIPGFAMLTVILGFNPINGSNVPRNAANIFRGIMGFLPGGNLIWEALNNHGIFSEVGSWIEKQLDTLGDIGESISNALDSFLDSLSWSDIFDLAGVWRRAVRIFTDPIDRIISFVKGLVTDILKFIRDAIVKPLASLAEGTDGWDLLIAVLGENPITGEAVPQTADNLIGGFMKLIGQEEVWNNIQQAGAIPRAWAWFQGAMSAVVGFVSQIPSLFMEALKSLEIIDMVLVPRAFYKVGKVFAGFVIDFVSWAGSAVWDLLKIIFEVVAPGAVPFLNKAESTFKSILSNPMGFIGNLISAGKLGLNMFKNNFLSILKEVLLDWLTGTLAGAGIYIPQSFDFFEIVKFILSILGLTWENIRAKLVEHLGEGPVVVLEEGFSIVKTLVTEGPAAAWEQIKEHLANLQDMVIGEITTWVTETVVKKAIAKVVAMFIPGGGFITAIIAIYDTIMVFIQRLQKIIQVGMAFVNSVADIAAGNIQPAAMKIVTTLKGLLVLAVSFFAGFVGLGKIGDALQRILKKIRGPIDKALDKVILWIKNKASSFLKKKDDQKHAQIANQAINDITQGDDDEADFAKLRQKKETKAKAAEQKYKGELKQGIGIKAKFNPPQSDKGDDDVDYEVIIAPNTTKKKGAKGVKTGKTEITVKRSTFRMSTKWKLMERDPDQHKAGTRANVKKNLDRRHIISSQNMAAHYESALNGLTWAKAKEKLEKKKEVGEPLGNTKIQKAARSLHKDFFNYEKNLFIGDSSRNRSIGAATDIPEAWGNDKAKLWKEHLADIKNKFALDSTFTPNPPPDE